MIIDPLLQEGGGVRQPLPLHKDRPADPAAGPRAHQPQEQRCKLFKFTFDLGGNLPLVFAPSFCRLLMIYFHMKPPLF